MSNLSELELQKWNKELDAREEYISQREELVKRGPVDLKILEETIKIKQDQIERLKDEKAYNELEAEKELDRLGDELRAIKQEIHNNRLILGKLHHDRTGVEENIKAHQRSLNELKTEIAEQVRYGKEQEQLMKNAVEQGNEQLLDLKDQTGDLELRKKELQTEVIELDTKKNDVVFAITEQEANFRQIETDQDTIKQRYEQELRTILDKIALANKELEKISVKHESKSKDLKMREEAIAAKQDAIIREREELETDKRRWRGTKSLYQDV